MKQPLILSFLLLGMVSAFHLESLQEMLPRQPCFRPQL
nr:Prg3 protein [Mus musculus]